jgi:FkbM family methyltransferase
MHIASSIAGARRLWATGKRLGLAADDRVKYALAYYLSRHAALAAVAPPHFVLKLRGKFRLAIRPNGVDYRTVADIFDSRLYDCRADGVRRILDLGANIGVATLFFAARFPQAEMACVEPSPDNQALLRQNIQLNGIRGTVFDGAVGTASGHADLYVGANPDNFSLTPASASGETLRVQQFAVPEVMSAMGWDEIDLLKIDIEGYEKTLFHSNQAWLGRVRLIIGEAHGHVGYGLAEVRADLEPFGFEVTQKSAVSEFGLTIFEARSRRGEL